MPGNYRSSNILFTVAVDGSTQGWIPLWTDSALLASLDHFKDLLEGDWQEASGIKYNRPAAAVETDLTDNDSASDEVIASQPFPALPDKDKVANTSAKTYEVPINHIRFTTMRMFLLWLQTGTICFAPIANSPDSADFDRSEYEDIIPSSPIAMYRLAHYYQIPELQKLALEEYRRQLDPAATFKSGKFFADFKEVGPFTVTSSLLI